MLKLALVNPDAVRNICNFLSALKRENILINTDALSIKIRKRFSDWNGLFGVGKTIKRLILIQ